MAVERPRFREAELVDDLRESCWLCIEAFIAAAAARDTEFERERGEGVSRRRVSDWLGTKRDWEGDPEGDREGGRVLISGAMVLDSVTFEAFESSAGDAKQDVGG